MVVEFLYAMIYVWAIGVAFWTGGQVKRFLATTPSISDRAALERYKALARQNMYLALVQIVVLLTGIALGLILIFRHGLVGFLVVLATNVLVIVISKQNTTSEKRARTLSAATEELAREHRRISETWVKKPLPDF